MIAADSRYSSTFGVSYIHASRRTTQTFLVSGIRRPRRIANTEVRHDFGRHVRERNVAPDCRLESQVREKGHKREHRPVRFEQPSKSLRQRGVISVKSASALFWVSTVKTEKTATHNALSLSCRQELASQRTGNSLPRIHFTHVPRALEIFFSKRDDQHKQGHRAVKSDNEPGRSSGTS